MRRRRRSADAGVRLLRSVQERASGVRNEVNALREIYTLHRQAELRKTGLRPSTGRWTCWMRSETEGENGLVLAARNKGWAEK